MTVVLGIDPGIATTGYGVIKAESTRYRYVAHGTIETEVGLSSGMRLSVIYDGIVEVVRRYHPAVAGVESLYFARNITSAFPVAQARGVLMLALFQEGVETREYPPQEIKQAISGSGKAPKAQVQELVRVLLGLSEVPHPDHAADALAAAICCYNRYTTEMRIEAGNDP